MATLSAEVQLRVSASILIQLTNADAPGGSIDTTVLDAAVADAEAEFFLETGIALNTSVASHVMAGVKGVLFYLHDYKTLDTAAIQSARKQWQNRLRLIDQTLGGGVRVSPSSSSPLEESTQTDGTRPDFDRENFRDGVLDMPSGGDVEPRRHGW